MLYFTRHVAFETLLRQRHLEQQLVSKCHLFLAPRKLVPDLVTLTYKC